MYSLTRILTLAAVAFGAATTLPASAQTAPAFPSKPVKLVVPFPPGGATDALARLMGEKLAAKWKQPVVIDNRPGGNTVIGTDAVAKSPPDGHTLGLVTVSHIINPLLSNTLPYDTAKDLAGVTQLTRFHMALYAHPSFPANTPAELMALARQGKVAYGSATTASYLGMELLNMMGGTKMEYIPYKGSAQAQTDLLGGHIQLMIDPVLGSTLDFVKQGRLKLIGTMGTQRSELTPSVPLLADAVRGYDFSGQFGLVAPGATPHELVRRIRDDFVAVMKLPEVAERIRAIGQEAVGSTPEEYTALIQSEMKKWAPVVKATGAKLD
ncbi:MAG TPA: tripartite tricarboxylate transporter substrate binding protein [Ideonella sp.]|nr:tripartite tricarboxylate transporter substrate binding protein [Ideonella sp.]